MDHYKLAFSPFRKSWLAVERRGANAKVFEDDRDRRKRRGRGESAGMNGSGRTTEKVKTLLLGMNSGGKIPQKSYQIIYHSDEVERRLDRNKRADRDPGLKCVM